MSLKLFDNAIKEFKRFKESAELIVIEEIKLVSDVVEQMNREQLLEGKKATGAKMPDYKGKKARLGAIKLFDKGDFHGGFKLNKDKDTEVEMSSDNWKTPFLLKYGDIFGLTPKNMDIIQKKYVVPAMQKRLLKIFN
jgi:hypothetical protein